MANAMKAINELLTSTGPTFSGRICSQETWIESHPANILRMAKLLPSVGRRRKRLVGAFAERLREVSLWQDRTGKIEPPADAGMKLDCFEDACKLADKEGLEDARAEERISRGGIIIPRSELVRRAHMENDAKGRPRHGQYAAQYWCLRQGFQSIGLEELCTTAREAMRLAIQDIFVSPYRQYTIGDEYRRTQWRDRDDVAPRPSGAFTIIPRELLSWEGGIIETAAHAIYDEGRWQDCPVVADMLMDAGCEDEFLLSHLRDFPYHGQGCWAIDLLTGRWEKFIPTENVGAASDETEADKRLIAGRRSREDEELSEMLTRELRSQFNL